MNTILQVISDTNIGGGGRSLLNYLSCQDRSQFQSQVLQRDISKFVLNGLVM